VKTLIIIFITILSTFSLASAQKISVEKRGKNDVYTSNVSKKLSYKELSVKMKSNEEAYKLISQARANSNFIKGAGFVGGFLIGWPIGTFLRGDDPKWAMAGAGLGVILITAPLAKGVREKTKEAVDIYNNSLGFDYQEDKPQFYVVTNKNGIGLSMKF